MKECLRVNVSGLLVEISLLAMMRYAVYLSYETPRLFSETSAAPPEFANSISGLAQPRPPQPRHSEAKHLTPLSFRPAIARRAIGEVRNLLFPSKGKAPPAKEKRSEGSERQRSQETFAIQTTVHHARCLRSQAGFCSPTRGGHASALQKGNGAAHCGSAKFQQETFAAPRLRSTARRVFRRRTGFALHPPVERSSHPSSRPKKKALL